MTMNAPDFLSTILDAKRRKVARSVARLPLAELRRDAEFVRRGAIGHTFSTRLLREGINVIAEIKRASPSKGALRPDLDPGELARASERGGAAALSVLTEEEFFKGSLEDLRAARAAVSLPVLRKDFVIDEWQIYESAAAGADAILLIVAALDDASLRSFRELAEDALGLDALVEVHTAAELERAEASGARLVGVNNRNLRTFEVSLETSVELAARVRGGALLVSESGLRDRQDILRLRSHGFRGFLIGETFMRAADPGAALAERIGARDAVDAGGAGRV
jgi:indole-3-glycerol phosphate synthase